MTYIQGCIAKQYVSQKNLDPFLQNTFFQSKNTTNNERYTFCEKKILQEFLIRISFYKHIS